jgi:glycosyltransferase involved in cell wall biosynthesis
MRIVIDMQGVQTDSRFRGIGRYTRSLVQAVIRNRNNDEIFLVYNGLIQNCLDSVLCEFEDLIPKNNIFVWNSIGPVGLVDSRNRVREEISQTLRKCLIADLKPDVILITSFFEGYVDDAITSIGLLKHLAPICVISYDFIPLIYSNKYLDPNPGYRNYYKNKVKDFRSADLFLAISEHSKKETIEQIGVEPGVAINIAAAYDPHFRPIVVDIAESERVTKKLGITKPFILYTGGADERKNLKRLVAAYAKLPDVMRNNHQLVFAGKLAPVEQARLLDVAFKNNLKSEDVVITGFVSDDELLMAYNLCQLFVFPSWHEGFGLPPLEAMACGAPVIASGSSSLPEVVGWDQALFDPLQVDSISEKIFRALNDNDFRMRLKMNGIEQAKKFSWDLSARKALNAMRNIYKNKEDRINPEADRFCPSKQSDADPVSLILKILHNERLIDDNALMMIAMSIDQNISQINHLR